MDKNLRDDFYITKDALIMLQDFLEKLIGSSATGRSFAEVIPETEGREIIAYVKQTPSRRDGDNRVFNEITSYKEV